MIPTVNGEVLAAVYGAAEAQAEAPRPAAPAPQAGGADGERPGDRYEREATWEEVFQGTGATLAPGNGTLRYVTRPGHDGHGHSATVGVRERSGADLLHVFTTNWPPFVSGQSYNKFAAYSHLHHRGDFASAAAALAARYRAQAGGADGDEGPTGYELILAWMRERYSPTYRRGNALYSGSLEREVRAAEATYAPSYELALRLMGARDVPRGQDGSPKPNSIPQFFAAWARVAWVDLLAGLKTEEEAEEVSPGAEEAFRGRMAALLLTQVTLGVGSESTRAQGQQDRQERRSLLDWAMRLGTKRGWDDVRSYLLWSKVEEDGQKRVALRLELFEQVKVSPPEVSSQRAFAELCARYGVGRAVRAGRARAVELDPEFLGWLLARPDDGGAGAQGDGRARTREDSATLRPQTTQPLTPDQNTVDDSVVADPMTGTFCAPAPPNEAGTPPYIRPGGDGELPRDGRLEVCDNGSVNGEGGEDGRGDAWEGPGEL